MKTFILFLTFSLQAFVSFSQDTDSVFISRISNQILTNGKAYDDLRVLTKQIGGRLSGSPQMVKAEQWGLKTMQGLHPENAWLQECLVPHWVRGGKDEVTAFYGNTKRTKNLDVL